MADELTADLVLDAHATLGEGPVWDADARCPVVGRHRRSAHPPFRPGDARRHVLRDGDAWSERWRSGEGGGLVAALADGVWTVDPESGAAELFVGLGEPPDVRSNESKCDPAGRFLVGTMAFDNSPIGSLYSVEADGSVRRLLDSLSIANGMAWTEDGGTFYYIDSPLRRVDAFDYDLATGAISGRRPYLTFDDRVAKPDGMSIDAEGGLWIAFWDAGEIRRYGPDRELDVVVRVPATQVTSGVFGGPDLRDLYITSATTELSAEALAEQPHAGGLFHVRAPVPGVLPHRFAG